MNRGQFHRLTTRQRTCCTVCFYEGQHDVVIAGRAAFGDAKPFTPLFWRRIYRAVQKHMREHHAGHPLVVSILGKAL